MKGRVLTGDTPTGRLHLGHWVGTLENRVRMQQDHECFFIVANVHAFTTKANMPEVVRHNVEDVVLDYLAVGIDPEKSSIFLQSDIPAIAELTVFFSMLLPVGRVMRNPTVKSEIRDKGLGDSYPFGFLLYPVGQAADILAFRPDFVPVGEDQLPHLEMTKEIARKFNQMYCNVDPERDDSEGFFPDFQAVVGKVQRLVGTGAPDQDGHLLKMSKSLGNAIMLSDSADEVKAKVMGMYTDPNRLKATDPGTVENNPLWIFHDAFTPDKAWVEEAKAQYRAGAIGDVACKKKLIESLNDFLEPIRGRRFELERDKSYLYEVLRRGGIRANEVAEETLAAVKELLRQDFGHRELKLLP